MVEAPRLAISIFTFSVSLKEQEEAGVITRVIVASREKAALNWEALILTGNMRVLPFISLGTMAVRSSPAPAREEASASRSESDWYCGSTDKEFASCAVTACHAK